MSKVFTILSDPSDEVIEVVSEQDEEIAALQREVSRLRRALRKKSRELRLKNEELRSYSYTVSHALKTPMISLRGFSSLLAEYHADSMDQEARDFLNRINKNVDQMERLIDDMLELSRIDIVEEEFDEIPIAEVLDEALAEFQFTFKEMDVALTVAAELPRVWCSRNLMIEVFTNLISNAIKYSRPGERPIIEIGYNGEEIFHKFFVKDNGVGIPPRGREKLFQLFHRMGNKKGVDGTGLGLAIVKRIVEGHGGEIWVVSKRGQGSNFFFTLPKNPKVRP